MNMPKPWNISCFIKSGHSHLQNATVCSLQEFMLHSDCVGIVIIPEIYKYVTSPSLRNRPWAKTILIDNRVTDIVHLKDWNISQMFNTSVSFSSVVMEWVLLQKGGHCSFSCSQRETISWNCLGTERPWDPVVHNYLQKNHLHHYCRWKRISSWSPPSDKKARSWGC